MVTAEFAVALPAFMVVLAVAIAAVVAVTAQLRCVDAASVAARMAARGDDTAAIRASALATAPRSAELRLARTASVVTATVSARLSVPGLGVVLPSIVICAHSVAAAEPTAPVADARNAGG
jgi:Flp pilus assembly protein TadG